MGSRSLTGWTRARTAAGSRKTPAGDGGEAEGLDDGGGEAEAEDRVWLSFTQA